LEEGKNRMAKKEKRSTGIINPIGEKIKDNLRSL
jgi:hypothetical protein